MPRIAIALLALLAIDAPAATVGSGFVEEIYARGFVAPTAMAFAPDGRLFVSEQSGELRVVDDGTLLPTPFLTLGVDSTGERGLLGVALDPNFAANGYVYLYYTARTPTLHNRVSRFTAQGNVAVAGSEVVLLNLDDLSEATNHNGGALHFGNDGRLYVSTGDNANSANAQSLANRLGKVLRINANGSIPTDNPFYGVAFGANRAIWAYGLRNPFTFAIQPSTGRIFINDVGEDTWEEINEGMAGANYGWPLTEGSTLDPRFTSPVHSYDHASGGCAITGAEFYEGVQGGFPSRYVGRYFFGDYCLRTISTFDPATGQAAVFASDVRRPVDIREGPDGALYYLSRAVDGPGINRIRSVLGDAPEISRHPVSATLLVGQATTFSVEAAGAAPLHYRWRRDGVDIAGANSASYRFTNAQLADSGARFDVVVSNQFGAATSNSATLTVTVNARPTGSITQPVGGTTYAGGDLIQFAGTGSDAEDGPLPASAFTWWVNLHHDLHTHPQVLPFPGAKSGTFVIPVTGETSGNVFYRIHLQVVDSAGLTRTFTRDLKPRQATVTLASSPTGLQLLLDGQPVTTPFTFIGVVGIQRALEAVSPQSVGGSGVTFTSWSDGGARAHVISTPATDTAYTADFTGAGRLSIGDSSLPEGNTGSRNAVFAVRLSAPASSPVAVSWATSNGSAEAGSDFVASSGTLSFPAGATSRSVFVPVLGDTAAESNDTFTVWLSSPSGASLADAQGTGTILNDDGVGTLRFGTGTYRQNENSGSVLLTVLRKDSTLGAASVKYATSPGTATTGSDFPSTNGTLNFAEGAASATVSIPIVGDLSIEADETFNVTLSSPSGALLGTPSAAVVTIANDDRSGVISFSTSTYTKSESGSGATITVSRIGGLGAGVSVGYKTTNGTATAGSDYSASLGSLVFAGGVASMTFSVPIVNDTVHESNETVDLTLANPAGGATLGARSTAVLLITDNDSPGTIAFSAGTYSRAENGGTATVYIKRTGGTASGVSVSYASGGGTATAGIDYAAVAGTVTFAAGQTSAPVAITLHDDAGAEGNETLEISLTNPTGGAALGATNSATLTILDDDD